MATLREIAERTGFSIATISRILNQDPTMTASDETRRKVLSAAGELNYTATKSHKGRSRKPIMRAGIAEMLTPAERLDDAYYLYLHDYVEEACRAQRIVPVPLLRGESGYVLPEGETVDGIIAIGIFTPVEQRSLWSIHHKIVYLDSSPNETQADSVVINFRLGVSLALDHLRLLGHTQIGFIGPAMKYDAQKALAPEQRRSDFIQYMQENALFEKGFLFDTRMNAEDFAAQLKAHLSAGRPLPTAFLTTSEPVALAALHALRENRLRVPEDISIVSFNDTPLSPFIHPPLTSISTHVQVMSHTAVRLILERIPQNGLLPPREIPQKVIIPPSLMQRESTARLCIKKS